MVDNMTSREPSTCTNICVRRTRVSSLIQIPCSRRSTNNNNEKSSCSYTIHACVAYSSVNKSIHMHTNTFVHTLISYTAAHQTRLDEILNGCFWHFAFSIACSLKSYVDIICSDLAFAHIKWLVLSLNRSANLTEIIWELLCIVRMPVAHFSLFTYTFKSKEPALVYP